MLQHRFILLGVIGFGLGILIRLCFEHKRFHAWDTLEDEVDEWRRIDDQYKGVSESP